NICMERKMNKQIRIGLSVLASALTLALSGGAMAEIPNPVVYPNWQSGNAAFECSQVGDYTYAWKIDEGGDEGAPNGSETANFYDLEGNLVHSNTITILNSDGKTFDWS